MRIFNEYESEVEDLIRKKTALEITETKEIFCGIIMAGIDSSGLIRESA
jgi:hypothetical protein|tara:strand:+ start:751 stop:897 length:147 start_codon:yes stop_codon:yes gene_type:complete